MTSLLVAASSASAVNLSCSDLQSQVSAASTGATIPIGQVYLNCPISYSGKSLVFQGTVPSAGFDGGASGQPIINIGASGGASFRDLTFKNGLSVSNGAAIDANGASSIEILRSRFLGNSSDANGGAVYLSTAGLGPIAIRDSTFGSGSSGEGNTATNSGGGADIATNNGPVTVERSTFEGNTAAGGGGLYVSAQAPVLRDNSFVGNAATNGGGGAALFSGPSAEITRSRFVANHVTSPAASPGQRAGGGLQAISQGTVTQTANVIRDNILTYNHSGAAPFPSGGGGEFVSGNLVSRSDEFQHNSVHNVAVGGDGAEGGGLFVFGCVGVPNAPRTASQATNLVAAGNSLVGGDEGAGVYVGCGVNPVDFTLNDSTIAGNTGGSPLDGGASDTLKLVNSIVSAGSNALSVTGFASKSAAFSDACGTTGHKLSGAGNFCADPRLKNAGGGDVHQTSKSPTRDRGSNARVPSGLSTDFEGGARITDAQPDAKAIVDVGADETPTGRLVISGLKLSKRTFRAAGRKPGTAIAFTITGPTPVRYSVARLLSHHRLKTAGSFLHTARAGRNHVKFTGRIGRTKLAPGHYRLTLKGKNRLNNRSNAISVMFVIAK